MSRDNAFKFILMILIAGLLGCSGEESGGGDDATPLDVGADVVEQDVTDVVEDTTPAREESEVVLELLEAAGFIATYEGKSPVGGLQFALTLAQPNDHDNPDAGTHDHYITLLHRTFEVPTILVSTGYGNYIDFDLTEGTVLLGGNQVVVDKRFHNGGGDDWSLFTREQVAADMHRVVDLLDDLYVGPWLNTGSSNGGVDAVFFQSRYPDDVIGTMTFGSPFMSDDDDRFLAFFEGVDPVCQAKLEGIQSALLGERRAAVEPLIATMNEAEGDTFERVGHERAFEAAVLSYPWLFWQYWGSEEDCDDLIDVSTASDQVLANEFFAVATILFTFPMSDLYLDDFGAYFYEVQRDAGWPMLPRAALEAEGLILSDLVDMEFGEVPEGVTAPQFDAETNAALRSFAAEGSNIIHIHSETDPWSAGAAQPTGASNSVYWVTSGSHNAGLSELNAEDQAAVEAQVQAWIDAAAE